MPESEVNAKFFDMINQEDWGEPDYEQDDPTIYRDLIAQGDVPIGNMIFPTPIPGVWISISMGFEIEGPDNA
jgi:hypothetical protein|tara:strand:- start:158 stop:373 length:216 start_codon:yes stop_codon:yes gene_type:complete